LSGAVFVLAIALSSLTVWREPIAQGQESKRYVYRVVDIPTDNNAMQTTLNEYGVAYGVQKITLDDRQSVCAGTACRPRRTTCRDGPLCLSILKPPIVVVCLLRAIHYSPATTDHRKRSVMHHHDQTPNPHMQHCLEACAACAQICDRCADDMIGMEGGSHKELQDLCIRLCMDCADFCALSTRWMSRLSPSTELLCRACAELCDRCASVCEQHSPHHPLCGDCAVECRRCAAACRDMAAAMA
jgi:hypothetical protein